jgi:hypothetical protein
MRPDQREQGHKRLLRGVRDEAVEEGRGLPACPPIEACG